MTDRPIDVSVFDAVSSCCAVNLHMTPIVLRKVGGVNEDWTRYDVLRRQQARASTSVGLDFDFDVNAGWQLDALQAVDRLRVRVDDVDQALVDAHLEVLA